LNFRIWISKSSLCDSCKRYRLRRIPDPFRKICFPSENASTCESSITGNITGYTGGSAKKLIDKERRYRMHNL